MQFGNASGAGDTLQLALHSNLGGSLHHTMHCCAQFPGPCHAATAHQWGCRWRSRRQRIPGLTGGSSRPARRQVVVRSVLGDQHHARVPGRAVQEQLEKKLRSLRERAARMQPGAEAATTLDQIERKVELLSWQQQQHGLARAAEEQVEQQQQVQQQWREWDRPERRQAVRQQPASLRQKRQWAPPWFGAAIYAVGALALALSFTAAASRKAGGGDVVLLHHQPGSVVTLHRQVQQQPRLEQLLGHNRMPEAPEGELVPVLADGSVRLRGAAASAFFRMQEAASRDGVRLAPLSGFRSLKEQQVLFYDVKAARVQGARERARVSAPPGFSEHHTGYALDVGDADRPTTHVEPEFDQTRAYAWLQRNAAKYHFEMSFPLDNPRGIAYEPWHWRFVGDDNSLWTFYGQGQQQDQAC